jgi:hypothetical protein
MILIVEDDFLFANHAVVLHERYTIKWVNNMHDAVYRIREEPGHAAFQAVVLDMAMGYEGLPKEALEDAEKIFPGYAFYKHVLDVSEELQKKTIFLTGFPDELKRRIGNDEYNKLKMIDKGNIRQLDELMDLLDSYYGI